MSTEQLDELDENLNQIDEDLVQLEKIFTEFNEKFKNTETTKEKFLLRNKLSESVIDYIEYIEKREFSKLGGDRDKIIQSAEEQVKFLLKERYRLITKLLKRKIGLKQLSAFYPEIRIDKETKKLFLDPDTLIKECKEGLLALHYEAFKNDQDSADQLDSLVYKIISENPKTSGIEERTIYYPTEFIGPVDIFSNKIFYCDPKQYDKGILKGEENVQKAELAKKSPIYSYILINIQELEGVTINGRKELMAFDREVHDAIVTLYVEGGNVVVTENMIYQMMTGKMDAHCSPKQAQSISESITKLMLTHVVIDAKEEAEKFGLKSSYWDSTLINVKRKEIVFINGKKVEGIKILDTPILYDYANQKGQIGRVDVKLLDSPVSKTEENIILEGYLRRRIDSIKHSNLTPTIVYETVYKQLKISAKTDGALRKKEMKVRNTVKKIMDFYKQEGFIKDYRENVIKGRNYSITIKY